MDFCNLKIPGASVFVNSKDADAVELRQLGQEDTQQGRGVDDEVQRIISGIKAGQNVATGKDNCVSYMYIEINAFKQYHNKTAHKTSGFCRLFFKGKRCPMAHLICLLSGPPRGALKELYNVLHLLLAHTINF